MIKQEFFALFYRYKKPFMLSLSVEGFYEKIWLYCSYDVQYTASLTTFNISALAWLKPLL